MRSEEEANRAISLYGDTVRRICMVHLIISISAIALFETVYRIKAKAIRE